MKKALCFLAISNGDFPKPITPAWMYTLMSRFGRKRQAKQH